MVSALILVPVVSQFFNKTINRIIVQLTNQSIIHFKGDFVGAALLGPGVGGGLLSSPF